MKKVIIVFAVIFAMSISVSSCKSKAKVVEIEVYQCPMDCEVGKTYTDKDTKCPVCNMALVKVDKSEEHHNH